MGSVANYKPTSQTRESVPLVSCGKLGEGTKCVSKAVKDPEICSSKAIQKMLAHRRQMISILASEHQATPHNTRTFVTCAESDHAAEDLETAGLQPPVQLLAKRHFRPVHFRPVLHLRSCLGLTQDLFNNLARGVELAHDVRDRIFICQWHRIFQSLQQLLGLQLPAGSFATSARRTPSLLPPPTLILSSSLLLLTDSLCVQKHGERTHTHTPCRLRPPLVVRKHSQRAYICMPGPTLSLLVAKRCASGSILFPGCGASKRPRVTVETCQSQGIFVEAFRSV